MNKQIAESKKPVHGLCKLIAGLLFLTLLIPSPALAAETNPPSEYIPGSEDAGAWAYILVKPSNGVVSRTHYVYSNYQDPKPPYQGKISEQEGMSYDLESNTLTISSLNADDLLVTVHDMGTGFKIVLEGNSALRSIKVEKKDWDSGLTITGPGSVVLGSPKDHSNVPLDIRGSLTLEGGAITCLEEITDLQRIEGNRYSFFVSNETAPLITSCLGWTGKLESKESTIGTKIISSKEKVVFEGSALQAPTVKRKSKRLVKCKPIEGCTYQALIDGEIIDMDQPMIKSKKKVSIRAVKKEEGSIIYSPWSKEV